MSVFFEAKFLWGHKIAIITANAPGQHIWDDVAWYFGGPQSAILFKTHFKQNLSLEIWILEALEVIQDNNHSKRL